MVFYLIVPHKFQQDDKDMPQLSIGNLDSQNSESKLPNSQDAYVDIIINTSKSRSQPRFV